MGRWILEVVGQVGWEEAWAVVLIFLKCLGRLEVVGAGSLVVDSAVAVVDVEAVVGSMVEALGSKRLLGFLGVSFRFKPSFFFCFQFLHLCVCPSALGLFKFITTTRRMSSETFALFVTSWAYIISFSPALSCVFRKVCLLNPEYDLCPGSISTWCKVCHLDWSAIINASETSNLIREIFDKECCKNNLSRIRAECGWNSTSYTTGFAGLSIAQLSMYFDGANNIPNVIIYAFRINRLSRTTKD